MKTEGRPSPPGPGDRPANGVLGGGGQMGALARAMDWAQTRVGPVESWPQSLRTALSILFESKFPMLLCWGPEFIQFYNDPFRPILGVSKHPALGKSTAETFAEAWHIVGPLFAQVMHGDAVGFDDMLVPLDRYGFLEECYFVYSYSPIRDESGGVGGVLVICTETTGRLLAERRLRTLRELASRAGRVQREAEAWHDAAEVLAGNAADLPFALLYTLDADGAGATSVAASAPSLAPARITASDPDAPWPLFEAARSAAPQIVTDVQRRFGAQAGPLWPEPVASAVVIAITRPGLPNPYGFLVAGVSPRLALEGHYRDFMLLVADQIATAIASARIHEEERRRTKALMELDRQKTAFFSNVSHEFRTPLALLLAPLEEALSQTPPTLAETEIELVYRNATRLLRLVNTLLDFARIEAGRVEAVLEPTDLAALTRDVASTFRSVMEQGGLDYVIDCPALRAAVAVDPGMWERILLNLLSNAFKFTRQGTVRVQLRQAGDRIELAVHDSGAGIPPADVPRVFERFHRVSGTPSRTFEGSGIGLSLVRELARIHGGEVRVDSEEGRGSTFTVSIPMREVPQPAPAHQPFVHDPTIAARAYIDEAARWSNTAETSGAATTETAPGSARRDDARLLVVDDNADLRQYLARLLGAHWTVELAANGREALQKLAEAPPDLILTDVMMPEVNGIELLHEVRKHAATRVIPVIMLSARSGEESRIEGLAAGADDYVAKPFAARELLARVRTQLELSLLRRETAAQNERLISLIKIAPAAIAVVRGPNHVFDLANDAYYRMMGRRQILGRPGREALPELTAQGVWDLADGVYASGEPFVAHEFRGRVNRRGTGALEEGFFNFVLQPLKNLRGAVEGVLLHAVDVTEQVTARQRVEDAQRAAEDANRAKDEFLAVLGHELRNPLAPILTALQLMTLRGDSGARNERDVIERQVGHVARLVDDLLDVSRIASGKMELRRERVELSAVVGKAVEGAGRLIEQKQLRLELDVAPTGLAIDGDPMRLQQVVLNLLNNAAKYTDPRGVIAVRGRRVGDTIELAVRDSGIGIEAELLPHVFELFVQERQALDRAQGGLGVGLALVRKLVEVHGGRVAVTSAGRGQGSEFVVTLPASQQPLIHGAPGTRENEASRSGSSSR